MINICTNARPFSFEVLILKKADTLVSMKSYMLDRSQLSGSRQCSISDQSAPEETDEQYTRRRTSPPMVLSCGLEMTTSGQLQTPIKTNVLERRSRRRESKRTRRLTTHNRVCTHLGGSLVPNCTKNLIISAENIINPAAAPNFAINSARLLSFI